MTYNILIDRPSVLKHIFAPEKQVRVAILFFFTLDLNNNARNTPSYPTEELLLSLNDNWLISENFELIFYRNPFSAYFSH